MKQKHYVIGNWKLYLDREKSIEHAIAIEKNKSIVSSDALEIVVCPSHVNLDKISGINKSVSLGAQDCGFENSGAHTGQVSPDDLVSIGCEYVIIGHSERRYQLGETDDVINRKIIAALKSGLVPIVCFGETFEANEKGISGEFVKNQIKSAFEGVSLEDNQRVIVAYEPVWAIYPSKHVVTTQHVHEMVEIIHKTCSPVLGGAYSYCVVYGGSVTGENVANFIDLPGINGVLPGHASTDSSEFAKIIAIVNDML